MPFNDNPRFPKRPRLEEPNHWANRGRGGGRGRRKNGPPGGRNGFVNSKVSTAPVPTAPGSSSLQPSLPARPPMPVLSESCDCSDSDDAPPRPLSTKSVLPESSPQETVRDRKDVYTKPHTSEKPIGPRRPTARQPRGPPPIPFGQDTPLLRNVRSSAHKAHSLRLSIEPAAATRDQEHSLELVSGDPIPCGQRFSGKRRTQTRGCGTPEEQDSGPFLDRKSP